MLAVIIIAVLFTALAAGTAWAASRGGLGGVGAAIQTQTRTGSRVVNSVLAAVYLAFGIAAPLVFIINDNSTSVSHYKNVQLTSSEQAGRTLFVEHCAVCHTLAAATAVGKVGPNLDQLKPNQSLILNTIANGCLQQPLKANATTNCAGYGTMPANLVAGRDAQDVAAFVAKVAGHT